MPKNSGGATEIVAYESGHQAATAVERQRRAIVRPRMRAESGLLRVFTTTLLLALATALVGGCASLGGPDSARGIYQRGEASYYATRFDGQRTASGERFSSRALTAAHRSLPMGTKVKVTNRNNGRSVTVRINDRGPHVRGRIIDLSRAAAKRLGMIRSGVAPVSLRVLD